MVISKLKIGTYLIVFAAGFFLSYLLFKNQSTTVTTPALIGQFKGAEPSSQKPVGEPLTVTWKTETETIYIKTEGEVNTELAEKYKDSLTDARERLRLYLDAITFREFEHTFEDENLKVTLSGTVQGYLKSVSVPEYVIHPQEVEVPVKRFGLSLYAGYGLSKDMTLAPQVGLGLTYSLLEF